MTALIIFAVVLSIGLIFYFSKSKKTTNKGGTGGKEEEKSTDPNYPMQK